MFIKVDLSEMDFDEHIPQRVSAIDVKASFEKAYWRLEPHLKSDNLKEISAATLRSVALNQLHRAQESETSRDTAETYRGVKRTRRHRYHETRQRVWCCGLGQNRILTITI